MTYAGRSSDAGVDQINITIPNGLSGCFVSVGIFDNGVPANFTSIAVEPNGAVCSDADLFSAAEIQSIASGNPMRLGTAALAQYTAAATVLGVPVKIDYEIGRAHFQEYSPANFLNSLTSLSSLAVSPSSCSVFQYTDLDFADPVVVPGLDTGALLNVAGGAVTMDEAKLATGIYGGTFSNESPTAPSPPFLKAGAAFTVNNGSGGADVGAFTFNVTLPPVITWTNKPTAATIPRNQNLTINWTGGDPTLFVYINGYSNLDTSGAGGEFVCVAPTSAGSFTVPAAVLSAMPVSANEVLDGVTIPSGLLVVNATTTTRPTAAGLDVFLVGASVGDAKGAFAFQ